MRTNRPLRYRRRVTLVDVMLVVSIVFVVCGWVLGGLVIADALMGYP